jgi:hypothetical protein
MFVSPFIAQSPIRHMWTDTSTVNSVLHRSFNNNSKMVFSFAYLDADRVRGISADWLQLDEVQDMRTDNLPIIRECLSASKWDCRRFTGTPKTEENTIEGLWGESSMAEWFIPCFHCTTGGNPTWNIPARGYHIERMIGDYHPDISEAHPAVICHKCGKPINPRFGRWIHRHPGRVGTFNGYHVPQIIMPMHYADPSKWSELLAKMAGKGGTTANKFWNEVLGEAYDTAAKLVTLTELNAVSSLGPNTLDHAKTVAKHYPLKVLSIDWGGGGEKDVSFTAAALLGLNPDGSIDVIWGKRLMTPHDHLREAAEIKYYWDLFKPDILSHDFTGAGILRETFLVQAGVPQYHIFPMWYLGPSRGALCHHVGATERLPRDFYQVDKSRMLLYTCAMIKNQAIHFFDSDYESKEDPGLIRDFLALYEEKVKTSSAGELYKIDRIPGLTDDFAEAVSMGCVAIWYRTGNYPNIAAASNYVITQAQQQAIAPTDPDWGNGP